MVFVTLKLERLGEAGTDSRALKNVEMAVTGCGMAMEWDLRNEQERSLCRCFPWEFSSWNLRRW